MCRTHAFAKRQCKRLFQNKWSKNVCSANHWRMLSIRYTRKVINAKRTRQLWTMQEKKRLQNEWSWPASLRETEWHRHTSREICNHLLCLQKIILVFVLSRQMNNRKATPANQRNELKWLSLLLLFTDCELVRLSSWLSPQWNQN